LTLNNSDVCTEDVLFTLNGDGSITIAGNLYLGNIGETNLSSVTSTTSTTPLTTTFDSLAIGWRETGSQATTIEIGNITVQANIAAVPEPATLVLFGLGAVVLGIVWRGRSTV